MAGYCAGNFDIELPSFATWFPQGALLCPPEANVSSTEFRGAEAGTGDFALTHPLNIDIVLSALSLNQTQSFG